MSVISLLYPVKCAFCGRLLPENTPEGHAICPDCRSRLPWTGNGCKSRGSFFSLCLSPLYYTGLAREGLLRFKFRGRHAAARCFGRLLAECIRENPSGAPELVTWVPLSLLRFRKRGYSQSRLLALALAKELCLPCRALLRKTRHTPPVSSLRGADRRRAAVSGAFAMVRGGEAAAADKCILLVDDVITTGATLSECSRVLLTAGAERVVCATLCRARG